MRKTVRKFAENEIAPVARGLDEREEFSKELFTKMGKLGLCGVYVPVEYCGAGSDNLGWAVSMEEIAYADLAQSLSLLGHSHAVRCLFMFGSETQKRKYLEPAAKGAKIAAFALTEPEVGSDASAIKTHAVQEDKGFVISGNKFFITNAGVADIYVVAARTTGTRGAKGISLFIVEKGTKGFSFGRKDRKMGTRASPGGELIFNNCLVSNENLLGQQEEGFLHIMQALTVERVGNAAMSVGLAQGAFDYALNYARNRRAFEQYLTSFQGLRWMFADMATQIEAARLLVYKAAFMVDHGQPHAVNIAFAKLFANELSMRVATEAVQILGGHGYMRDHPVEKMMRDAKMLAIGGGTTQVQRDIIAKQLIDERYSLRGDYA